MTPTYRSIGVLLIATSLWGASSALIAVAATTGFTAAPLVAAGGAVVLLFGAAVCGDNPWRIFTASPGLFVRLGLLEVANLVLYVAALRLGPLPIVVALHLTAPMLIITTQILRRRRALDLRVIVELMLVAVAIWLVAGRHPGATATTEVVLGCVLALASAACVALLISLVASESPGRATLSAAGLQLLIAAVLGAPLLAIGPPTLTVSWQLLAIGGLLLGPGFACYWWALRNLDAPTAGIIGLNEAIVAAVVGVAVAGSHITAATLVAAALVLTAVGLEVRSE